MAGDRGAAATFWAVLGALVVFGVLVLGYQALTGPSDEECLQQRMDEAIALDNGLPPSDVDPECD